MYNTKFIYVYTKFVYKLCIRMYRAKKNQICPIKKNQAKKTCEKKKRIWRSKRKIGGKNESVWFPKNNCPIKENRAKENVKKKEEKKNIKKK